MACTQSEQKKEDKEESLFSIWRRCKMYGELLSKVASASTRTVKKINESGPPFSRTLSGLNSQ
jgi:hypothetical protein